MKRAGQALAICIVVLGGFWATSTRAYQAPDAKAALAKDDSCITCHGGTGHVTDIYQSRHGNKADPRTPGCVNCHGASDKHMTDPAGIAPDVVFAATSKRRSPAAARSGSCLTCHASHVLPRTLWAGSQHESRGVSCTDCHNIHASDQKVMNKATQAEVCVACHRAQRAEIRHLSGHPLAKTGIGSPPTMACSDCHDPH
jgi:DmsE family decaheme c-type cytochrome